MGWPDDLKLKSSMTLFAEVAKDESIFWDILEAFYQGEVDQRTLDFLSSV